MKKAIVDFFSMALSLLKEISPPGWDHAAMLTSHSRVKK